ncbi:hypothetical protein DMENIID0001_114680 [Sergentomyia squamirostris]
MLQAERLLSIRTICGICIIFLPLFVWRTQIWTTGNHITERIIVQTSHRKPDHELSSNTKNNTTPARAIEQNSTIGIQHVIATERKRISNKMRLFKYPAGESNQPAKQLTDLTPETGGTPIRSLLFTTNRSGSTFFGEILNSMPGNYYHYEPLNHFGIAQIRNESDLKASLALSHIKKLLRCDYTGTDMRKYLNYSKNNQFLFKRNSRLWRLCQLYPNFCWQPNFLISFCSLFPLQSMKVVRVSLSVSGRLLEDLELNVRMVLLIRDPRGTLQSRKHEWWCHGHQDCDNPSIFCKDLVADYYQAQLLLKNYPKRFHVVRYEDICLKPYEMTKEILQFYGLPMDPEVEKFINSHTKVNIGNAHSTYRDSKSAPFHWINDLSYGEIDTIQNGCSEAMKLWGYKKATNSAILGNKFNPILPYSLT